jgi:tetratricopeptide (TPR) repeat protein
MNSLLKQERINRRWSRAYVEKITGIPQRSLENWEEGGIIPRQNNIELLCRLYDKTPEELGFGQSHDIMGITLTVYAPQEGTPMSDLIRRAMFSNLGSRLTGLIDTWPKRNYRYEELQGEINKAIFDHHVLAPTDNIALLSRREALQSVALVPVQMIYGVAPIEVGGKQKTDTDLLLKHCAAGITACWYLLRGKELNFVSDLMSTYISLLQPTICSHSEAYRNASATLLSQSFRLRGSITESALKKGSQAIPYYQESIRYAQIAGNRAEQAIASRMMAFSYEAQGIQGYEQALSYAQAAYGLMEKTTPKFIRSFITSGLSLMSARNGNMDDAIHALSEAHDLFDPMQRVPSVLYAESNLLAISAHISQHCGQWGEAIDLCEKSLVTPDISARGSVQRRIQYAKTEVSRDDQPRDMDLCIKLLSEVVTGAKELDCKRYQDEASEVYDLLRIAWPREDVIKTLGRDYFSLAK